MKKRSQKWREFGQILEIVDIRIGKVNKRLEKLRTELKEIQIKIDKKWIEIEIEQDNLQKLSVLNEDDAISRMFRRREYIKSKIESLFFDVSLASQNADEIKTKIDELNVEKNKFEKRKESLAEIRSQIEYE